MLLIQFIRWLCWTFVSHGTNFRIGCVL